MKTFVRVPKLVVLDRIIVLGHEIAAYPEPGMEVSVKYCQGLNQI